jgi:pantetheine-phosphate adenylyltransferase
VRDTNSIDRKLAIYPGSFDPITNGHIELIARGLEVFDHLIVAVAHNLRKQPMFTTRERVKLIREAMPERPDLEVDCFEGLLVDYAASRKARVILRGLRAVADFEYEFQMANMNKKLDPELETLFMMTGEKYFFLSSQNVREVAAFGGPVDELVPPNVAKALRKKLSPRKKLGPNK